MTIPAASRPPSHGSSWHSHSRLCLLWTKGCRYWGETPPGEEPGNLLIDPPRQQRIQAQGEVLYRSPMGIKQGIFNGDNFRCWQDHGERWHGVENCRENESGFQNGAARGFHAVLLLEKIVECLPRIAVARRRSGRGTGSGGLCVRSRCRVFFHRGAEFVKFAVVLPVLWRNAFRDRLRAFKLRAGIEVAALFAAVQFQLAFRARSIRIETRRQHRTAIRAARACHGSHHARRARPELIRSPWPARGWFAVVRFFFFLVFFRVAVPAVTVLSIHKRLRPPVSTDCHGYNLCFCAVALANLAWFQSDCYTRPDCAIIP